MTPTAQEAYERVVALQELTEASGLQTYKSQTAILKALNPTDMADVARRLKETKAVARVLRGTSKDEVK
jgi:hypothetical protein